MEMPAPVLVTLTLMARPISALDARIVACTSTLGPPCVRSVMLPKRCSIDTLPPRNVSVLLNVLVKRSLPLLLLFTVTVLRLLSASAGMATAMTIASAAKAALLIRDMGFLPQHVLERLLLRGVHREELAPEVRVLSIAFDVGLALGDRVVEQDEFLFVADHERRARFLERRVGELLEACDRLDVFLLRVFDVEQCLIHEDAAVERLLFIAGAQRQSDDHAEADHDDERRRDLHPSHRRRAPRLFTQRPLDPRPKHVVVPCRVQPGRGS